MEVQPLFHSELKIEITEKSIKKKRARPIFQALNLRFLKNGSGVAPLEYKPAYEKNIYPRTVFKNSGKVISVDDCLEKISLGSSSTCSVPLIEVDFGKDFVNDLQQKVNLDNVQLRNQRNLHCLSAKAGENDAVLRNSITNQLFRVNTFSQLSRLNNFFS